MFFQLYSEMFFQMVFTPNPAIEAQIAALLEEAKAFAVDVTGVIPVDYKPGAAEQPARLQAKQQSAVRQNNPSQSTTAVNNAEERINSVALAKGIRFVDKSVVSVFILFKISFLFQILKFSAFGKMSL